MSGRRSSLAGLVIMLAVGCSPSAGESQPRGAPAEFQGKVDSTLPKDLQAKQKVVSDLLANLQDGYPIYKISKAVRGLQFDETEETFYEGARKLVRWGFNGAPQGDEVPVVLVFATIDAARESDQAQKKVERTYVVRGSSGQFTISRK